MMIKNCKDYLYLIWKSPMTRRQYIVGQLTKNRQYEFQYVQEVDKAIEEGFTPLMAFPNLDEVYYSDHLFLSFSCRLPDEKRKDIDRILKKYGLYEYDAYELLKASGARLPIDNMHLIDPIFDTDVVFERKFSMAGVRHYLGCSGNNCEKSVSVALDEEVFLQKEPENEFDSKAIRIVNRDGLMLGYVPRYYCDAFNRIMNEGKSISCHVFFVNKADNCSDCILLNAKIDKG